MEPVFDANVKKKRKPDSKVCCFICSAQSSEECISQPSNYSYEKLCECLIKRAKYGEEDSDRIVKNFGSEFNIERLKENNVKWHRSCYQTITHKKVIDRLKKKFECVQSTANDQGLSKECIEPQKTAISSEGIAFTRSQTVVYEKDKCFFCDQTADRKEKLRKVSTDKAGRNLREAIELRNDDKLRVRLSEAIDSNDAHAIDVLYHRKCWTQHVTNILRSHMQKLDENSSSEQRCVSSIAAEVEFINIVEEKLSEGKVYAIDVLEETYKSICASHNVLGLAMSRKQLKVFIETELSDKEIEFSRPRQRNRSERVSMKCTREVLLAEAESYGDQKMRELNVLFQAANIIRSIVLESKPWHFDGSVPEDFSDIIPNELNSFFKWCIGGKRSILPEMKEKHDEVERRSRHMSQIMMSNCLSRRQVENKLSTQFYHTRELPLQVAMGLTIHGSTRSQFLVNLVHSIGCSIDYRHVLKLETQIAASVLKRIQENNGVYIPPDIAPNRFIHCAVDNLDFSEDTADGRRTLHGTVITVYQIKKESDTCLPLSLSSSNECLVQSFDSALPIIQTFANPPNWKTCSPLPVASTTQNNHQNIVNEAVFDDAVWFFLRHYILTSCKEPVTYSPTWAGYNSLMVDLKPVSRVAMLPMIPEPPTSRSVQVTVMEQLEKLNKSIHDTSSVVEPMKKRVVVTADMALYKPIKQLEMTVKDLKGKWLLKPGELHIIIAQLRTIGELIEGSGIPELWVECDLYSAATKKQILDGRHIRRAIEAHITTVSALTSLLLEEFEKENPGQLDCLKPLLQELVEGLTVNNKEQLKTVHKALVSTMKGGQVLEEVERFTATRKLKHPLFKLACTYMDMVQEMMNFIRAVRTSHWRLYLSSLHKFVKYFFAFNRLNYARMITLYLSEMENLESEDPEIWKQFMEGNWVVNRSLVPFCALGADEALEHQNRKLKVRGGLVGITLNENARNRFFLANSELTRIASETDRMMGCHKTEQSKHHEVSVIVQQRQDKNVLQLKEAFENTTNPFHCKTEELIHILTQRVFPQEIKVSLDSVAKVGQDLHNIFLDQRVYSNNIQFWDPLKKNCIKTCKTVTKKVKIALKDKTLAIKTDLSLISRLLIASRSRPDIDLRYNLSNYEFSALPKSLFAVDGSMHHCLAKYKLIDALESMEVLHSEDDYDNRDFATTPNVEENVQLQEAAAIVDGMALLHTYHKPNTVKTVLELGVSFSKYIGNKFSNYSEVHVIFDSYRDNSLKKAMRDIRQKGSDPIQYKIRPETKIASIPMNKLLAHDKTKDELTEFLSEHLRQFGLTHNKRFVMSWRDTAASSHGIDVSSLSSTQEEADTKIILHAAYLSQKGTKTIHVFSPDTDVFILALRRYPQLSQDLAIFLGRGMKRFVQLNPIYRALGPLKASALPGLHSLSGADVTGSFAGKGKLKWWKTFNSTSENMLEALAKLGTTQCLTEDVRATLEAFICQLYIPNTSLTDIGAVRWLLFTQKQYEDEALPPTRFALDPALLRAHLQCFEWNQDLIQHPNNLPPSDFGWKKVDNTYEPVVCTKPCAPELILELCRCSCFQRRCAPPCTCHSNGLRCTEMCRCEGHPDHCDNMGECGQSDDEDLGLSEICIESDDD